MKSTNPEHPGYDLPPDTALFHRSRVTRNDLFRELDYLVEDLGMADALLRREVRRRVTRIRALASTLIPKEPDPHVCGCGIRFRSRASLNDHLALLGHKEAA